MSKPVTIIMIEDDEGHARLIERNIRRSGVNNQIIPFTNGTAAVNYLFGSDGTGLDQKGHALLISRSSCLATEPTTQRRPGNRSSRRSSTRSKSRRH